MAVAIRTLYGTDFVEWASQTAALLRQRRFDEIDIENVAEEFRSLGESEFKSARLQLRRMLTHLIKQKIQPERDKASWRASIVNAQQEMLDAIDSSPGLRRRLSGRFGQIYAEVIQNARYETGLEAQEIPAECPFTLAQLLDGNPTLLHF